MRKLLNTLYVVTPNSYLSLDGENVVVLRDDEPTRRIPLHNLESIISFGYSGASPALMGKCASMGIALSFCTANGRYLASVVGEPHGNVLLRRKQYRVADDKQAGLDIARNFLIGKLHNCRWVIERATRDHPQRLDVERLKKASGFINDAANRSLSAESLETLRGIEGDAASKYFSVFDDLVLQDKEAFSYTRRMRRPPMDRINALLSFTYTLLANDSAAAASSVGLDPYVGFLHKDRPGRRSLALDLMEEMRSPLADRFVLSLINLRQVQANSFEQKENGAVFLTPETRKRVLSLWHDRKHEQIVHPFLKEKMPWGLVPHVQALLLARHLRGDLDEYPPFLWK